MEFEKVKADLVGVDEMDSESLSNENDEEVLTQEPSQQQDSIAYRRPHALLIWWSMHFQL